MNSKVGLFLGTKRGYVVLDELIRKKINVSSALVLVQQSHEIDNYTQKIIDLCIKNKISYETSTNIKSSQYEDYLKKSSPDVVFVISWRFLIPDSCFGIPKFGMFNLHDALLPKNRGFAPTNWVIINGDKKTGLTLHYIDNDVDNGDIVDQIEVKIASNETANTLNEKFLRIYPEIILKNLDLIFHNKNKRIKQNHKIATYLCKRTPQDGKIDFSKTTKEISRLIRGLSYPYPGAYCYLGDQKIIIWEAEAIKNPPQFVGRVYGRVIKINKDFVDVLTGDSVLRILKISTDGKPNDFLKPSEIIKGINQTLS